MTTRLLRASLGSPGYDGMRATLRATGAVEVVRAGGLTVRAATLPLFKRRPDGGLRQVVRVAAEGAADGALTVRLLDGAGAAVAEGELGAGGPVDLYVPEVSTAQQVALEVSAAGAVAGTGAVTVTPQRKWTVYVVHHSHLDIGYTDRQGVVLRNHLEYLDSALDLAAATDDWDDAARFRWSVESALPVRRFLDARPERVVRRFVDLARDGRIEVTAMPFQLHTEACSVEELHRQLRFTDELRTAHDIPITSAMHTDVPGAVVGFVDALAASGVRYLSAAHNWAGRSVPFLHGGQDLGRPFWWRSPAGNRLLVWYTDTPHGMAYMEGNVVGLADDYQLTVDLLPGYLHALATEPVPYGKEAFGWSGLPDDLLTKQPYPHDLLHLRVQGGHADNAGPSIIPAEVVREWNEQYAYPRLRMATNSEFFVAAEERIGDIVPEHTGDWTDWWADGLGSGARPLGYARRAQHAVRHAETLHTLAALHSGSDGKAADAAEADRAVDAVYDKLGLFDEHTWGAANPWHDHEDGFDSGGIQWARKCEMAYQAGDDAEDLRHAGARRLGSCFAPAPEALAGFLVVNPGPFARTDVVTAFLPASVVPLDQPVSIVDAKAGGVRPHDEHVVRPIEWPTRPAGRWLRFPAGDVPAVGHRRFDVVAGDGPVEAVALAGQGNDISIENEYYRLRYDLGAGVIASIVDKEAGRELVNAEAYAGMNQYVYDRYSTTPHVNHLSGHITAGAPGEAEPDLALLASRGLGRRPSLVRAVRTAVGEELEVALDGDGVDWLRTTITLPTGARRVDITNRIHKQGAPAKESVFFAFPFAGTSPPVAWELTGGVGGSAEPTVPGAAAHMKPIRHWVVFADDDTRPDGAAEFGVAWATLQAPLAMLGDLYLPYAPFPPTVRPRPAEPATVYSWALNNIWDTNFPAQQQGEITFQYAIGSGAGDPRLLGQGVAAGLTDPLLAVPLTGNGTAVPESGEFVAVGDPRVQVSSVGASRRGHDVVVYLRSVAAGPVTTTLRLPFPVSAAHVGTSLERELRPLPVSGGEVSVPAVPPGDLIAVAVDLEGRSL